MMKFSSLLRISIAILLVFLTAGACAVQKESSMAIDRISVMGKNGDILYSSCQAYFISA